MGGKSVPVGSAADENKHFEEAQREHYRRHGPRARATFAAHGGIVMALPLEANFGSA